MKITTWNVNGLRASLRNGIWDWVAGYIPDILCLQEIKVRPEQLTHTQRDLFAGLHSLWNPAMRLGYSGVASFLRHSPLEFRIGIGEERFDIEGRAILTHHPGFWLFNLYVPSGQRDYGRVLFKLDFYASVLDLCEKLLDQGEQVILCGDFNTAHREIDIRNPKQNMHTSGFLPEERAWIDRFLENGFLDAYREIYPERIQYSWWTYISRARSRNVGWRLDYFLISEGLINRIEDAIIHDEVTGSDHCPVTLVINDSQSSI